MYFSIRPLISTSLRLAILSCAFAPIIAHCEVRLLTGDANNAVHQRGGEIKDLSADGNLVLFTTLPPTTGSAPGITAGGLYLRNISANTLQFVSDTSVTYAGVRGAEMSDDGRYLTWTSTSNLRTIYWRDRTTGITRQITPTSTGDHGDPRMSADGRYVAFVSASRTLIADTTKLPNTNRGAVYVYDSVTQLISIASLAPNGSRLTGLNSFSEFDLSADGRYVVYSTDDPNAHPDKAEMFASFLGIFRRNLVTGEVVMVNRNSSGNVSNGNFNAPRINADGSRVVFGASVVGFLDQKTMIPGYANLGSDVYVKELDSGAVWLATKTPNGVANTGALGTEFAISDSGSMVAYASSSDEIIPGSDSGGGHSGSFDVFRADLGAAGAVSLSQMTKSPTNSGNVDYRNGPFVAGTGDYVAFGTDQLNEMGIPESPGLAGYHSIGVGTVPVITPAGPLTFTTWASALPTGEKGHLDNPAKDGVPNLMKYFIGSNPSVPDLRYQPKKGKAIGSSLDLPGDTSEYLTLTVRIRRSMPAGFTWEVQAAATLADLPANPVTAVQVGSPFADGDFDLYLFRYPTSTAAGDKGFMRLKVNAP